MPTVTGEPEVWDDKWQQIGAGHYAKLYTRGRPRNQHEFNHQVYFCDLWLCTLMLGDSPKFCEFGAGRGTTAQYLTQHGCDVTLLDLSRTGFEVARRNFAEEGMLPPRCVLADVSNTPFPDDSYDCVYSIGLLEHFDDPKEVLAESIRVMKSGGVFFHTICDGDVIKSGGVHRTNYKGERYEAWAIEAGAKEAQCIEYRIPGVLLLTGRK